jgi:hypothetical protein
LRNLKNNLIFGGFWLKVQVERRLKRGDFLNGFLIYI